MTQRKSLAALVALLQFLALSPVHNVCAACDGFDTTALNKLTYDSSGYEYGADFYLAEGDYIVVDDMESYNDSNNIIWHTWLDGCGDANGIGGNGSGSCVFLTIDPCGPVHGGTQSMAYLYDNRDHGERCGGYSEIDTGYYPPVDWASHGEKVLALWFRGSAGNQSTTMWVVLECHMGNSAMSFYGDNGEDPEDIKVEEWTEWNIKLSDFADGGVDLANVQSISIGFGDWSVPDFAIGTVYFDDIRVYPARCLVKYSPAADFTGDCAVNWQDLEVIAREWLHTGGGYSQGAAADDDLESDYDDCQAWGPDPPDDQTQVRSDLAEVILSWQPGNCIGMKGRHFVYFSTDESCVTTQPVAGTPGWDTPPPAGCYLGYTCPSPGQNNVGILPMWTTYYWRIDEGCADASVCKGQVWSFTTGCDLAVSDLNVDCLVNFEDYTTLAGVWMDQTPPWPPE
ncbi:MAG: hypothetical protein ACYST6_09890 [Planctomycetota bacterium]